MQQKYFAGVVQPLGANWKSEDVKLRNVFARAEFDLKSQMEELQFHRALEAVWGALDHANRYIVQTAPFTLIKDPTKQARVGEVLHHLLEAVRTVSRLLGPFMPDTARELRELLAIDEDRLKTPWGDGFTAGHKINPPKVLFPRIEIDARQ
jgi:methionyl-tRNA synthetase